MRKIWLVRMFVGYVFRCKNLQSPIFEPYFSAKKFVTIATPDKSISENIASNAEGKWCMQILPIPHDYFCSWF
jgi:hypothetical protein